MLYINGDSWSFRHQECDHAIWPEIVARYLNLDLLNDSLGCGSNSRILDSLKNRYLLGSRATMAIFGLTSHHRYHLPAADLGAWVIGPDVALHEHSGERNNTVRDFFFKHCYSEIDSLYRYYRDIWSIHEMCAAYNWPYLCFQTWDRDITALNLLGNSVIMRDHVRKYYNQGYQADLYITAFTRLAAMIKSWNYHEPPISSVLCQDDYDSTLHPNKSGHQKIAEKVLDLLKEYDLT